MTGAIGGLDAADAECQARADAANIRGTFRAWLSDSQGSPSTRFLKSEDDPYVLADTTTIIALNWDDLITNGGDLLTSLNQDENGAIIAGGGDVYAWTGTTETGELASSTETCNDWVSSDPGDLGVVGIVTQQNDWTNNVAEACSGSHRLFCFQQGP